MKPQHRFAPVSSAPSNFVNVAAGYFVLSGVLNVILMLVAPFLLAKDSAPASVRLVAAILLLRGGFAAAYFWTAQLLSRRSRKARYVVLALVLMPVIGVLLGAALDPGTLIWTVLSFVVLAVIWRDLNEP